MIMDLHNSNKKFVQVTLSGEEILEEKFFILGFVLGKDVKLDKRIWFVLLDPEQISLVDSALREKEYL